MMPYSTVIYSPLGTKAHIFRVVHVYMNKYGHIIKAFLYGSASITTIHSANLSTLKAHLHHSSSCCCSSFSSVLTNNWRELRNETLLTDTHP